MYQVKKYMQQGGSKASAKKWEFCSGIPPVYLSCNLAAKISKVTSCEILGTSLKEFQKKYKEESPKELAEGPSRNYLKYLKRNFMSIQKEVYKSQKS